MRLAGDAIERFPAFLLAIVVLLATRFAANVARRSATSLGHRLHGESLKVLTEKLAVVAVWVGGILIACLLLFPGLRLGDIVATLGLGSVAIGFAFQDIFKNFLAGVLLLLNEPFRIGDQIVVGEFEGTVEHIDIRFTSLQTYKGERVLLPNSLVFTSPVQVRTAYASRRTDLTIGLAYGTDLRLARETLERAVRGVEGVLDEPAPLVDVTDFDESSMDVVVRYWSHPQFANVLRTQTRAILAAGDALREAGIETSFPTRTLIVATKPPPEPPPP
ncbi:MAG: mechanosensitive ion channel family protein [Candidatus Eremiobacteraeota bacterium]|nr:mechanosensitive ion channel family protein [Candidatus Eremiobacteraeota bacterium]